MGKVKDSSTNWSTTSFGSAVMKAEGVGVKFDADAADEVYDHEPETTYVERRVPVELEDEAHELLDNWLKTKGFDPEEI